MPNFNELISFIKRVNLRSIYFNFKYLPFKQACKLPILISRNIRLKRMNGNIIINVPIQTALIQIGYSNVGIFDRKFSKGVWEVSGTIVFNGKCNIGYGAKISVCNSGRVVFGNNFIITAASTIVASTEIVFGNECLISWDVLIMDTDFHKICDMENNILNHSRPINIGNHVWIGCRSLILKGSLIPDNCVIGANTLISKVLERGNSIYSGNPCHIQRQNIN